MSSIITFLILIHINTLVLGYYFYNPNNQELFESSSKNFPKTYVRIGLPRNIKNGGAPLKRHHRSSTGTCRDAGFICNTPFNKTFTAIFECKTDNQCPGTYKCCDQKCFVHKICVQSSSAPPESEDGTCEKWPYNCQYPYPYIFSHRFRCEYDKQCPQNYKCCHQNCFLHKICSKKVNVENQTPKAVRDVGNTRERISVDLEPPAEIRRYNNNDFVESETAETTEEVTSTTMESSTDSTTTTTKSWFSLFGSNSKTEDTKEDELEEDIEDKDEENEEETNDEDANEENETETEKEEVNEEADTNVEEDNENLTEANPVNENEETVKPEDDSEGTTEEVLETTEATEPSSTEETTVITTTTTTEGVPITDKVTVVVLLTPDPNSIESILLQNTPSPLETEDEKPSSTRDPEYEEYYEHYDANGDDEDENEEKKRKK